MNAPLPRMLRSYQQRAATYLYEHDSAFLIAPLGAGKGAAPQKPDAEGHQQAERGQRDEETVDDPQVAVGDQIGAT